MTQKEIDMKADSIMKEFLAKISEAIDDFKSCPLYGPVTPLLQRLEEARFWLRECIEKQEDYIGEIYDEDTKEDQNRRAGDRGVSA